jgi:ABC-type Zn uptake system ZnuABC Zn-binding protein ZnuA
VNRAASAILVACVALLVGACGRTTGGGSSAVLRVVTTTTVFADLVARVGGERVTVVSLVPKGGEVHTFDPTPGDFVRVAKAQLLVANGLGLDDWLVGLVGDAGSSATTVRLGDGVPADRLLAGESGSPNPHAWLDVALAEGYVARIADALSAADPAGASVYSAAAAAFAARLTTLDGTIRQRFAALPADRRRVISFHDAFPYYARAYGLEVVGTLVHAPGQDPSAGEIAALVDAARASRVSAIIAEAQFNSDLVRTLADETGTAVVSDLYDDTLGDPPVDSYEGLITWDTDKLLAALAG